MKPVLLRPNPLPRVSQVLPLRKRGLPRIPPRKARALPVAARPVLPAPAPLRAPELPQAVLRVLQARHRLVLPVRLVPQALRAHRVRALLRVRPALPVPQAPRVPRLQVRLQVHLQVHLQVRLAPRVPRVLQVLRIPLLPQALRAPAALLRPYGPSISRISRGGIKTRPGFCSPRPKPVRPRAMPS
ncbi:MAG: hypothetical protein BWY98_00817 [Tenericutes bacterium ADurb.BinA155]|nr:MAG: hypothetical protein BWY98_00817 [Tenericutes bacterium ADurb.BinA155]